MLELINGTDEVLNRLYIQCKLLLPDVAGALEPPYHIRVACNVIDPERNSTSVLLAVRIETEYDEN